MFTDPNNDNLSSNLYLVDSDSLSQQQTIHEAFMQAACMNRPDEMDIIAKTFPINVNYVNRDGHTALIFAAKNGHINVVRRLIEMKANVDYQEPTTKNTALHYAAQCGHTRTAEMLIHLGKATIDILNQYHKTPFDLAADFGHGQNKVMQSLFVNDSMYDNPDFVRGGLESAINSFSTNSTIRQNLCDLNNNNATIGYPLVLNNNQDKKLENNTNHDCTIKPSYLLNTSNRGNNKSNCSYLPCSALLESLSKHGCYIAMKSGSGFRFLAKNGTVQQMVREAAKNLNIPFQLHYLKFLIRILKQKLNEFRNNKRLGLREIRMVDASDHNRMKSLVEYSAWRQSNSEKILSMISYLKIVLQYRNKLYIKNQADE